MTYKKYCTMIIDESSLVPIVRDVCINETKVV